MSKNYRFKDIKLRAWNKNSKKMIYSHFDDVAFAINSTGFNILSLNEDGSINPELLGNDEDSILMQGAGRKDEANNDIYEGDVVFLRKTIRNKVVPVVGIVNSRDFTFVVSMAKTPFGFDYSDKNTQIVGNIFEHSDADLAAKTEALLKKYEK